MMQVKIVQSVSYLFCAGSGFSFIDERDSIIFFASFFHFER